jgi:hypothetical protein
MSFLSKSRKKDGWDAAQEAPLLIQDESILFALDDEFHNDSMVRPRSRRCEA